MPSVFLLGYFLLLSHSSLKKKPIYSVWERKLIIRGEERSIEKVYPGQKKNKNSLLKILRPVFTFENMEIAWKLYNLLCMTKNILCSTVHGT